MLPAVATGLFSIGSKLIDHWFPDAEEADKRKTELLVLAQQGELKELEIGLSAIIAEANSSDKWTSRARPAFLYIIYIMILMAIPMGILSAFEPEIATRIASGIQLWLAAIPESLWGLFGAGYLGYTGAREYGKHSKNKHKG